MTFPKTKLSIFPENFKLTTVTVAVPGHRELGGPIQKVSLWGEHCDADALYLFAVCEIIYTVIVHVLFIHFACNRRIHI